MQIGKQAELVVVAPATANLLAKAAYGLADDLLTNTLLTAHCPVIMFPAMHTEMWEHPATRANVATLRDRGVPGRRSGFWAPHRFDSGPGRLPEPEAIAWIVQAALASGTSNPTCGAGTSSSAAVAPANASTRYVTSGTVRVVGRPCRWPQRR